MTSNLYFKTIVPLNISFENWSIQIQKNLPEIKFAVPIGFDNWQNWAIQIVQQNPQYKKIPLPIGQSFSQKEDWRKWAKYFISALD